MTDIVVFWDQFEAKPILPGLDDWDQKSYSQCLFIFVIGMVKETLQLSLRNAWVISPKLAKKREVVHNFSVRAILIHMHIIYRTPTVFLAGASITGPLAVCVLQG